MVWGRQITILRHCTMEHKNGRIPSHRASQKLSIGAFGIKFNPLSFGVAKSRFYDILQWNTKTAECRATRRPRSSRSELSASNSILYRLGSPNHDSTTFYNDTQKRLNAEPQGVPEALDRSFRQQIQFWKIDFFKRYKRQKRPNTEPQGVPEFLDDAVRYQIKF